MARDEIYDPGIGACKHIVEYSGSDDIQSYYKISPLVPVTAASPGTMLQYSMSGLS